LRGLLGALAFSDDQRDVVELLIGVELPNFINDPVNDLLRFKLAMSLQGGSEPVLAIFFTGLIESIEDAISVERERVAGSEFAIGNRAFPFWKEAQYSAGGVEAFEFAVRSEQQAGVVSAIRIAQAACAVVVLAKEQRCIRALDRIGKEELIDGL